MSAICHNTACSWCGWKWSLRDLDTQITLCTNINKTYGTLIRLLCCLLTGLQCKQGYCLVIGVKLLLSSSRNLMSWFLKVNVSVLIMDMTHCLLSIIACNIKMYHIIFIKVNLCVYDCFNFNVPHSRTFSGSRPNLACGILITSIWSWGGFCTGTARYHEHCEHKHLWSSTSQLQCKTGCLKKDHATLPITVANTLTATELLVIYIST